MNLRLRHLLSRQAISNLTRLNTIITSSSTTTNSSISIFIPLNNTHNNAPSPFPSSKPFHSSPNLKFSPPAQTLAVNQDSDEDEDVAALNEFLSRFVHQMRSKINESYPNCDKQTVDAMLVVIVEKLVAQLEKGETLEDMERETTSSSVDLSDDLWTTMLEVSNVVYQEMEREKKKEKMKKFLQSEDVKAMARFASEVGVRGDMLRELRFKWAREVMEEREFYEGFYEELDRLRKEEREEEEGGERGVVIENGDENQQEEQIGGYSGGLPKRHGKIKYKLYGLDMSGPEWKEVADKIHEAGEVIWPQEAKPITGKCKLVTEKILALEKDDDDWISLLDEWVKLLQPNRVDWVSLLGRLKEKDMSLYLKVAEHVLREPSFHSDIRDYSKLIDIHAKENRLEDAERILKKMSDDGMPTDIVILTALVNMYSKAGNLDRAKEAFETLRSQGFKPDLKVYSSMIMAYVNAGKSKDAENLLRELETRDIKPTEDIYMALLRGYAQSGNVAGAQRMDTCMKFAGFEPTLESFTLLVEAFGKSGNTTDARNTFEHMKTTGFKPDDRCTASMISAYGRKNELDKALKLLLQLEKDGFEPGLHTYCALVDWLSKLLLVDEAEQMLGKIAQLVEAPPLKIQVSLCDMYARAGIERKALQILGVLEAKKELLDQDDFERVITGLEKGGFMPEARRIQGLMEARGIPRSEKSKLTGLATQSFGGSSGSNRPGMR